MPAHRTKAGHYAFGKTLSQPTMSGPQLTTSLTLQPNILAQPIISQQTTLSPDSVVSSQLAISPPPSPSPAQSTSLPQFTDDGPLSQYFSQTPSFIPNPNNSATSEFYRMSQVMPRDDRKVAHEAFKDALTQEFNVVYGTDVDSLASWQALCSRIGISPVPETLEECKQVVMNTHINLVDLTSRSGAVEIFQSVKQLSKYTIENGKFFPRNNAYAGDLLRYLLRHIFAEMDAEDGGGSRNRRGKQRRAGVGSSSGHGRGGRGRVGHGGMPY